MRHLPFALWADTLKQDKKVVHEHDPSYCIIKHLLHQMKYGVCVCVCTSLLAMKTFASFTSLVWCSSRSLTYNLDRNPNSQDYTNTLYKFIIKQMFFACMVCVCVGKRVPLNSVSSRFTLTFVVFIAYVRAMPYVMTKNQVCAHRNTMEQCLMCEQ